MNQRKGIAKIYQQYLEDNPVCIICGRPATEVHHVLDRGVVYVNGERVELYLDQRTWAASCHEHHYAVEFISVKDTSLLYYEQLEKREGFAELANTKCDKYWNLYKKLKED